MLLFIISYLKSSLDRFIETVDEFEEQFTKHLKSSLDRFIEFARLLSAFVFAYLKSSLDRFIGATGSFKKRYR